MKNLSNEVLYTFLIIGSLMSIVSSVLLAKKNADDTNDLKSSTDSINKTAISISQKSIAIAKQTESLNTDVKNVSLIINDILKTQENLHRLNADLLSHNRELMKLSEDFKYRTLYEFEKNATTGTLEGLELDLSKKITVINGGNQIINSIEQFYRPQRIFFPLPLTFKVIDNHLTITTTLRDKNGNVIIDIIDNKWLSNSNSILSMNYNQFGMEIIDQNNRIILSIRISKNNELNVNGIYYFPDRVTILSDKGTADILYKSPDFTSMYLEYVDKIKPIFLHHGKDSHGKMVE